MRSISIKNKHLQSEVITTVLLVLVGIAAVVIVGTFVIKMVNNNLKSADCFKTAGQITLNMDYTYIQGDILYVSITRGQTELNISGIKVIFGTSSSTKAEDIIDGEESNIANGWAVLDNLGNPVLGLLDIPKKGETRTYAINYVNKGFVSKSVNNVVISPIMQDNVKCDKTDEQEVTEKT